jgi:UDP-N-acetylmuramate--alanine ligase
MADKPGGESPVMRIHLIGIGGAGLSAIATVLLEQGHEVSGSDMVASPVTERLIEHGAKVYIGHAAQQLGDAEAVVVSSAIPADNPELVEARQRGTPVFKRAEWLGRMMAGRRGIAIAGTHGKTTTTALIALILRDAGEDPTFIVGGVIPEMGAGAAVGCGPYFVIEADEYDYTFLGLKPEIAVLTSVDWDHPDCFPSEEALRLAFRRFLGLLPADGLIVACGDEPGVRAVLEPPSPGEGPGVRVLSAPVVTYGLGRWNDWRAECARAGSPLFNDFSAWRGQSRIGDFRLSIPGVHNVKNALAALVVADHLGLDLERVGATLRIFRGVARRFELKGEAQDVVVIDDYAHHPTEVRATLAAARERYPERTIWAVFQPHTFSRTSALLDQFAASLAEADQAVVTAIFAAREQDDGSISGADIVKRMPHQKARYIADWRFVTYYLLANLRPGDLLLTLGAGDVYKIGELVLHQLAINNE